MSDNYDNMWKSLGLDLDAHDALLGVLGPAYQETFLSQNDRPKSMEYFDFVMSEVHGLRVKELMDAKEEGRKVVGSFCVFVPEELILAVDAISVGLCAGAEFAYDLAEELIPTNTCSLIKSAFGFKLAKVCPYMEASDIIVGENTCDGKKKAYEQFKKISPNLYVMDLPQMKSEAGKRLLLAEYKKFMAKLEDISGEKMTAEKLVSAIETVNKKRLAMKRLAFIRKADPAPVSGLDALLANQLFFFDDPKRFTDSVNKICDELEERVEKGTGVSKKGAPRVLMTGCPMALPNWKVPAIVEGSGAVIVGEELCTGERGTRFITSKEGDDVDSLLDRIVDRYFDIDCAVFTPNPSRLEQIKKMAKQYKANGVILYNLQFCQPYQMESIRFEDELKKDGVQTLRIDTDYSQEDTGQIKTRVDAFIEMIG
jgi:benzoyl-CoA reductase/2-hydroxyglutaryl-CoA dehydratase subunit BcrC/BadD/HgdB